MKVERRAFLKSGWAALAAGFCDGLRVFAAPPGWKPAGKPALVFGILSDTHLQSGWDGFTPHKSFPHTYVTAAMKYFRDRNIDAFMHLGDMAHRGKTIEAQYHRDIFEKFFPRGKARDGHSVEKLLVVGNHEWYGEADGFVGASAKNIWKDPAERAKHTLCADMPKRWEQVWGGRYEDVWHKEVKGYHFFGRHWDVDEEKLADFILSKAEECSLAGSRPFFILSHRRHHFHFFNALKDFPNAVAFFGHWHQSNADWKTIYMDGFGAAFPSIQCACCRMDGGNVLDAGESVLKEQWARPGDDSAEQTSHSNKVPSRQGMVVNVFDDCIVFERHEFGRGGKLGPDWVLPLGWREKGGKHPFSREELKKAIGSPEFPKNAKLEISRAADGSIAVAVPLADGNPASRAFAYDIVAIGDDPKKKLFKSVYWEGCNLGVGREPDKGVTKLVLPGGGLPEGKILTIAARPVSSLGTKGAPLVMSYTVATGRAVLRKSPSA